MNVAANLSRIDGDALDLVSALHPYEISVQVPGTWINRNSGQEQLTAIRSPVLTGAGSCGAFLVLEDGIPTRPAGFCNVNQLFEVPTELASAVEVLRGPTNAYFGSNGLHGTINILLPTPGDTGFAASLETGSHSFARSRIRWDDATATGATSAGILLDHDGGYRDESGYEQVKAFVKNRRNLAGGVLQVSASLSELDQETAGYITGFQAYKNTATRFGNPNPEAFREAGSRRLAAVWQPAAGGSWQQEYRAYLRNSEMEFLQHFLPGQPLEENGQTSGGLMFSSKRGFADGMQLTLGADAELVHGYLRETQAEPATGSAFLIATRPVGKHYDYDVFGYQLGAFAALRVPLKQRWELQSGARMEYLRYRYDNNMLSGNTRDDGTPCGFGGCQYNRPADRSDAFFNIAPNVGVLYRFDPKTIGFANLTRGFRAPQATELYRLQRSQTVAEIDSETVDALEAGIRHQDGNIRLEAVAYLMRKRHFIFRDAADFNVSNGKTEHSGVEVSIDLQLNDRFYAALAGSFSRQEYRFDSAADQGETIVTGNAVDTAPELLGSARIGYTGNRFTGELEWTHTDGYFLDAANTARYEGHHLLNLRLNWQFSKRWSAAMRINNLTDELYADRADLLSVTAPPVYRYFPGHPREVYVSLSWQR